MSSAERIALKRLKRRRIIANRLKSYGSVFSHSTMRFRQRRSIMSRLMSFKPRMVLPTPVHKKAQKEGFLSRFINKFRGSNI